MVGAIFAIFSGIFCLYGHKKEFKPALSKISAIPKFRIKDIIDICNNVREEMGTNGYFNMMVEIEGSIKNGNFQSYCYEGSFSTIVLCRIKDDILYVEDDTGRILVKTDQLGSFIAKDMDTLYKENKPTIKITKVKDVYGPIYVVGEASDASGELVVQKPQDINNPFIVSFSSRKEFMQHKEKPKWGAKASGIIFLSLGNICLLIEIMKMLGYY
jgi:hypothetical protein